MDSQKQARYGAIMAVTGLLVAIYMFGFDIPRKNRLYAPPSQQAVGSIVSKDHNDFGRRQEFHAVFRFKDVQGGVYEVKNRYPEATWNALSPQQSVTVRYLPSNPEGAVDIKSLNGLRPNMILAVAVPGLMMIVGSLMFLTRGR
jgi:hypothetical protein